MCNFGRLGLAIFCCVFFLSFDARAFTQLDEIVTLKPRGEADNRYRYVEELLRKVLQKADINASVTQAASDYSRDRLLQELIVGENIQVIAEAPKPGWEEKLIPIRIPLRKGIQGFRLLLINRQDQEALAKVENLEDLMAFPTGSGSQWSTRVVMENAGFEVITSEDYETLFRMLQLRRFVTFGRGVNEAFEEQASFSGQNPDLIVEETLCIYIPLPTYFFVSPAYPELAEKIEAGLMEMIEDGSFDEHFRAFHEDDLKRANLGSRKIFTLTNPNLSEHTPFEQSDYWFDPASVGAVMSEDGT